MIRLMCPHCQSIVQAPDSAAGHEAECTACGKTFPAPARYTPVVAVEKPPEPPPPPPVVVAAAPVDRPPPPPGLVELPLHPDSAWTESAYAHHRHIKVCPTLIAWLPAVCLVVILLLSFFPWVGAYPGGYSGYTQSPWGAMIGNFSADPVVEDMLHLESPLRTRVKWDWVMVPYLLGLLFVAFVAITERIFHKRSSSPAPQAVAWLGSIWTHRITFLTACSGALLCLLVIQMLAGFGLESGLKKEVAAEFAEKRQKAGNVTAAQNRIDIEEDMKLASYCLHRTTLLYLALVLNVLVVIALFGRMGLDRRGTKPMPRLVVEY